MIKTLKKRNLKIDDVEDDDNKYKQKGSQNKYDKLYNLADSQSVEL